MHPFDAVEHNFRLNRRQFFRQNAMGLGGIALGSLLGKSLASQAQAAGLPGAQHFPAKAKRCIYLSMIGAPSQFEMFDPKPELAKRFNEDLPASIRNGQRITGMTSGQARFPVAPLGLRLQAVRPRRHLDLRPTPVHGQDGRRYLRHQDDEHGGDQP